MEIDYEEAYQEDKNIRTAIGIELNSTLTAANQMVAEGYTDVHFSGDMRDFSGQPTTENWQKAIGAHNYWSDSHLRVEGDTVHLTVTVSEGDLWNFNRGKADLKTGASDNENGRFQELGWAREFETHGELTREYTWTVGETPPFLIIESESQSSDDERT